MFTPFIDIWSKIIKSTCLWIECVYSIFFYTKLTAKNIFSEEEGVTSKIIVTLKP